MSVQRRKFSPQFKAETSRLTALPRLPFAWTAEPRV